MSLFASRLTAAAVLLACLYPVATRAAAPAGRYLSPSSGVVHDSKTGLDWQQATSATTFTYANALTYCTAPWRLPTIRELQSLVDDGTTGPLAIDTVWFPSTKEVYWSSTIYALDTANAAWAVAFRYGFTGPTLLTSSYYVRCVR